MVGSEAIIFGQLQGGGTFLTNYYLASKSTSGVQPDTVKLLAGQQVGIAGGLVAASFTVDATVARNLDLGEKAQTIIIFATGQAPSSGIGQYI